MAKEKPERQLWGYFSDTIFSFEKLLQSLFTNYGKNWATLFKPQLSNYPGSDFINCCFSIVKGDLIQLWPTKKSSLQITII